MPKWSYEYLFWYQSLRKYKKKLHLHIQTDWVDNIWNQVTILYKASAFMVGIVARDKSAYHEHYIMSLGLARHAPLQSHHSFRWFLLLLSLFSSKTIFTSIIYILCSLMWKNNELYFFFLFALDVHFWFRTCCLRTLLSFSLCANFGIFFWRFFYCCFFLAFGCVAIFYIWSVVPWTQFNCWFHSVLCVSRFALFFGGKYHLFYWFWYMDDDRHKQFIIQLNVFDLSLVFSVSLTTSHWP